MAKQLAPLVLALLPDLLKGMQIAETLYINPQADEAEIARKKAMNAFADSIRKAVHPRVNSVQLLMVNQLQGLRLFFELGGKKEGVGPTHETVDVRRDFLTGDLTVTGYWSNECWKALVGEEADA